MKRKSILYSAVLALLLGGFTACEDMLDVSSSSVQYEDSHELNSAADSLYSVVGILSKLQTIADRTVLLGELRGDLVTDNENTEKDLRELINHEVSSTNVYNDYTDYYAIINNCNYYLAKVDTNVIVSNQKVMEKEVAVVKGIRAWTYMQLALIYKSVPFITEPILTLQDAEKWEKECEYKDLLAMCEYFIPELLPYLDTDFPNYGGIGGYDSKNYFFPISLLLGDMCLWMQDYANAYVFYAYYAYKEKLKTHMHGVMPSSISPLTNDISGLTTTSTSFEHITFIPMASSKLYGITSNLENVFSPTDINEGKRQVSPSYLWKELSEKQVFAYQQNAASAAVRYLTCGDLRAVGTYYHEWSDDASRPSYGISSDAWYLVDVQDEYKINGKFGGWSLLINENSVSVYRVGNVFLRMAEALNRVGDPEGAFAILKHGVSEVKMSVAGELSLEPPRVDEKGSVVGIHSRGSGGSSLNKQYEIDFSDFDFGKMQGAPSEQLDYVWAVVDGDSVKTDSVYRIRTYYSVEGMPDQNFGNGAYTNDFSVADSTISLAGEYTKDPDTIRYRYVPTAYLVDKVEQMIVDEMALETAFEGHRYYDLMRVAIRRNSPAYLAEKVASRNGKEAGRDEALYNKLNDPTYESWYIHKK